MNALLRAYTYNMEHWIALGYSYHASIETMQRETLLMCA